MVLEEVQLSMQGLLLGGGQWAPPTGLPGTHKPLFPPQILGVPSGCWGHHSGLCSQPLGVLPTKNSGTDTNACPHPHPPSSQEPHPADPKPEVGEALPEATWGCRPDQQDPAPASLRCPEQGVYSALAPCQGQVPRGILPGHGDDGHLPLCSLGFPIMHLEALLKEGPGSNRLAQGVPGWDRSCLNLRWARGCLLFRLHLQTPTCSGPYPGKSPGRFRNPRCLGLSGACAAASWAGQQEMTLPFPGPEQ